MARNTQHFPTAVRVAVVPRRTAFDRINAFARNARIITAVPKMAFQKRFLTALLVVQDASGCPPPSLVRLCHVFRDFLLIVSSQIKKTFKSRLSEVRAISHVTLLEQKINLFYQIPATQRQGRLTGCFKRAPNVSQHNLFGQLHSRSFSSGIAQKNERFAALRTN